MSTNVVKENYLVTRQEREVQNNHKSGVLWFTGLSGSGKSTLAKNLERALYDEGHKVFVLDGDNVRFGLNKDLGFTKEDRKENLRRIAEIAKLLVEAGNVVLSAFISPLIEDREMIKNIIGENDFKEVYVATDIATCEERDVKGLYAKARSGEIKNFTGISAPYEAPLSPGVFIKTENRTVEECVSELKAYVLPLIEL